MTRPALTLLFAALVVASGAAVPATATAGTTAPALAGTTADASQTADRLDRTVSAQFAQADQSNDSGGGNATAGIAFSTQQTNGSTLSVASATLPEGGFVVLFAETGEQVGNSTYLEPGSYDDLTIRLNETLEGNRGIVAVAHRDSNDNRRLDFDAEAVAAQVTVRPGATTRPNATDVNVTDPPYTTNGTPVAAAGLVVVTDGESDDGVGTGNATRTP